MKTFTGPCIKPNFPFLYWLLLATQRKKTNIWYNNSSQSLLRWESDSTTVFGTFYSKQTCCLQRLSSVIFFFNLNAQKSFDSLTKIHNKQVTRCYKGGLHPTCGHYFLFVFTGIKRQKWHLCIWVKDQGWSIGSYLWCGGCASPWMWFSSIEQWHLCLCL